MNYTVFDVETANSQRDSICSIGIVRYEDNMVNNQYICTMELAKKIFKNDDSVQSYRLDALSQKFNIKLRHHHNALDDTRACLEILKEFEELYPEQIKPQPYIYGKAKKSCCCEKTHEENR